jgi:DNA-binding FadR family transcriptional regulator
LATRNTNAGTRKAQLTVLKQMEDAASSRNSDAFAKADLDGHALIWKQAQNFHLEKTLRTMIGPIFMFMANSTEYYNWEETLELHRDLVNCINSEDEEAATDSIRRHLANSRERAIGILKTRSQSGT